MSLDFTPTVVTDEDLRPVTSDVVEVTSDEAKPYGFDPITAPYGTFKNGKPRKRPQGGQGTYPANTPGKSGARNAALAAQAAEALGQIHDIIAAGLYVLGLSETASVIAAVNEPFKVRATAALITDEKLCRSILRAGTTSAKVGLVIAYGMAGATVAPVAIAELKEKRLERENRAEE